MIIGTNKEFVCKNAIIITTPAKNIEATCTINNESVSSPAPTVNVIPTTEKTPMIPIIIHFMPFPSMSFVQNTASFFAESAMLNTFDIAQGDPIFLGVNEVNVGIGRGADLASEFIWQFTLVATAEEFLKLGILVLGVLLIHGAFRNKGLAVIGSAIVSIVFWTNLHLVQALGN